MRSLAPIVGILALGGSAGPAVTQPTPQANPVTPSRCEAMSAAIRSAVQEMSYLKAQDVLDNSAPRATMRAGQVGNLQAAVQSRITLMGASQCAPYDGPLSPDAYIPAAMGCIDAETFGEHKVAGRPAVPKAVACDRATWQPKDGAF